MPVEHRTLFTCERKQKLGIGTSRSSLPEERASHVVVKVGHNVTLLFFLFFLGVVLQCCINNLCCRFVVFGGLPAVWCTPFWPARCVLIIVVKAAN